MSTPREKILEKDVTDWKRMYFKDRDGLLSLRAENRSLRDERRTLEGDQNAFRAQIRCDHATIRKLRTTIEALRQSVATKNCIIEAFVYVAMAE